ncbi:hypothetical protein [Streptomyces syringium]|uniref:hypothetical protein n=1 Tax=Streptomyces syringium TaxID=76729 RepID=UPI003437903C
MAALPTPEPEPDLPQYPSAAPLYRLAGLMRSIGCPDEAAELDQAAASEGVLNMAYARLQQAQSYWFDPPRHLTREQWKAAVAAVRDAKSGVDWLHSHGHLPNSDTLLVHGAFALLQAAGKGTRTVRLARGAVDALDQVGSHCAAIALGEDPLSDPDMIGPGLPRPRAAREAAATLARTCRIQGYGDAQEQARIHLVKQARALALQAAARHSEQACSTSRCT